MPASATAAAARFLSGRAAASSRQGDVFLMNPRSADSLDGRYFGPLPAASIVGRAIPLWVNQTEEEE